MNGQQATRFDTPILDSTDVAAAARWLADRLPRTPVLRSPVIDRAAGCRMLLKAENLQLSGSYKIRGAMRAVGRLAESGGCPGVLAQSTGNHALAVALATREYGLPATVVLPTDAPATKIAGARRYGAEVVLAGTSLDQRLAVLAELRSTTGYQVVDPYDHPDVIAGQGTASLELIDEAAADGTPLDALVIPVGGGGGIAGACLAVGDQNIKVYGVEPVGCDSLAQSLAAGSRRSVPPAATLADGLRPAQVGVLPFDIARRSVAGVVRVDDDAIAHAFRLLLFHSKVLVEPSGAAGLAGALRIASAFRDGTVGVVLTGGNVSSTVVARMISGHRADTRYEVAS